MKKIILIIVLIITIINTNLIAQSQFSGWYEHNPNTGDIVLNTAITNFVSGKMLKIDSYFDPNSGYYFELTFLNDNLTPVNPSIRYDFPTTSRIKINDVKYDADNNCYIACGEYDINGSGAFIICFDINGNITWKKAAYDFTNQTGISYYRRVEVCRLSNNTTVYAACGYVFRIHLSTEP